MLITRQSDVNICINFGSSFRHHYLNNLFGGIIMIEAIIFNIAASIGMIYFIGVITMLLVNTWFAYKYRNHLINQTIEERYEEVERIKKIQSKYVSWLIHSKILISTFTFHDYKREVLQSQNSQKKSLKKPGIDSIVLSIFLMLFSILFVGMSIKTDYLLMQILLKSTRLISILVGLVIIYRNIILCILQSKQKNKFITIIAILFNLLAIFYFGFVSYYTIAEIF